MPQGKLCTYKHIYSVTSPHTRVLHSQICWVYYQKDLQVTNRTQLPSANNKNEKDNGLAIDHKKSAARLSKPMKCRKN